MEVTVTTRHQQLDTVPKGYAQERIEKVMKMAERLGPAHIILDHEHDEYVVEVSVTAPRGAPLTARAEDRDLRAAIDSAASKLETQVRAKKSRRVAKKRRAERRAPGGSPRAT